MNRLDRYLMRNIFALTGIVALVLISIYTFVVFVSDLGELGQNGFGPWQLLEYALLLMPGNAYILMPIVVLLGTLLGVGNMARQGELTAMRSAGVSWLRIGSATLIAGVALGVAGFVLGNWLAPQGQRQAGSMRTRDDGGPGKSQWLRDTNSIVRIRELHSAREIEGVTIYTLAPSGRIASALHADSGRYVDGHWQLKDVRRSDFDADHVGTTQQPQATWSGEITPTVLNLLILKEDSLSVQGLLRLVHFLDTNHLDAGKYRMLMWRRLVEPLTIMVLMLFALPFAGGSLRQTGTGQRLLFGILIGVAFYVADKVSVSLGDIYGWSPLLAAGAPTALLASIAVWRLSRLR